MSSNGALLHRDDRPTWRGERGHIAGRWRSLTGYESRAVGVERIRVDPGKWATPLHLEGAEEETRGGRAGLTVLMCGNRDASDLSFYPRSGKVVFRGLGLAVRLAEPVGCRVGED